MNKIILFAFLFTFLFVMLLAALGQFGLFSYAPLIASEVAMPEQEFRIETKIATDLETEWIIALRFMKPVEHCAMAGRTARAWLRAQNPEKYREWKRKETQFCDAYLGR